MHWLPWWAYPAACCVLVGICCGWVAGYLHRDFIEWGRRCARMMAWRHRRRRRDWRKVWS